MRLSTIRIGSRFRSYIDDPNRAFLSRVKCLHICNASRLIWYFTPHAWVGRKRAKEEGTQEATGAKRASNHNPSMVYQPFQRAEIKCHCRRVLGQMRTSPCIGDAGRCGAVRVLEPKQRQSLVANSGNGGDVQTRK